MVSCIDLIEDIRTVSKMSVGIGEISRSPYVINLSLLLVYSLQDARVEDRCFGSGVDAYKQNEIGIFNAFDLRVEQVV